MRRGEVPDDGSAERTRPALAHEQCACAQLADWASESEWLEVARARVVVQIDGAHV
jgi:hypothetical protein